MELTKNKMNVLVLDAAYRALGVTDERTAVVMTLFDVAEVVVAGEGECRSPSISVPIPEVVRLMNMVAVPEEARIPLRKDNVLRRDRGICAYRRSNPKHCKVKATTMDHVRPRSRNGPHHWTNVVASCDVCNSMKADSLLSEIGWDTEHEPYLPHGSQWLALAHSVRPSWEPYLNMEALND